MEDSDFKWPKHTWLKVTGIIAILVVVGIIVPLIAAALGWITLPFLKFESKVGAAQGIVTQAYSTQYCLDNYHWFLETYQDIQQKQAQTQTFQAQLTSMKATYGADPTKWGFTTQQSFNEVQSELTGVQNAVLDETGQYNAKTQELDRVACKGLPLNITP
jgi:hypothetical protein